MIAVLLLYECITPIAIHSVFSAGADVNAKESCWGTPLHCMAHRERSKYISNGQEIGKYLLSKGADIDGNTQKGEVTPLYDVSKSNPEFALWFLENGADPNVTVTFAGHTNNVLGKATEFPTGDKYRVELIKKNRRRWGRFKYLRGVWNAAT